MKRINFETAKMAKEAGYDTQADCPIFWIDGRINIETEYIWQSSNPDAYPAPYQAELQSWLRDEHGIHVEPYAEISYPPTTLFVVKVTIENLDKEFGLERVKMITGFRSYEDALEEGLVQSLKIVIDANNTKT